MGRGNRSWVIAGAAAAVLAIAGCGSSGGTLLSSAQASQLTNDLSKAKQALDAGNCQLAADALVNLNSEISQLNGVNSTLVSNLRQGVQSAQNLANTDCPTGETTTTNTHTTKSATDTTTTSSQTKTTDTATNTTTTSTTVTTTPITPLTDTTGGGPVTTAQQTTPATSTTPDTNTSPDSGGGGLGGNSGAAGNGNAQ